MSSSSGLTPQILLYRDMLYLAAAYRRTMNGCFSGFSIYTKDCTAISRSTKVVRIQLPTSTYFKGYHTRYQISGELQALLRDVVSETIRYELETRIGKGLIGAEDLDRIFRSCFETLMGQKYDEKAMDSYMMDGIPHKQVSDSEGRIYTVIRGS
jgi:hypothetical protein